MGDSETCTAGNGDGGEFQRAVGSDEAPQRDGHTGLLAGNADCAEHKAIHEHEVERADAEEQAASVGGEGHRNVVGHDAAGGLGGHGDDRSGPHFMVLDAIHDDRAEDRVGEVRVGECAGRSDECRAEHDDGGGEGPGKLLAEESGVSVAQIECEVAPVRFSTGIDDMVGASQQMVDLGGQGGGCAVLP